MTPEFPFAALVALDELRLALRLASIDRRLSVLLRGDKGAGKSTAARGLGALLSGSGSAGTTRVPFVNLPIGATEDRILGGLDIARAMNGEPALKPGLLAAAHGGILYIDEVNLLPDHLADAMLDAVASGVHVVEREGISARQDADFVLIGSMNPEEGTLRPQLLDRFALVVDATAPLDPIDRRVAVERRLAFDRDPAAFAAAWRAHQDALALEITRARSMLSEVVVDAEMLDLVSQQVCAHAVRSLRADLAIVRASRALAALEGVTAITSDHIARVLPLALRHRVAHASGLSEAPPSPNAKASTHANASGHPNEADADDEVNPRGKANAGPHANADPHANVGHETPGQAGPADANLKPLFPGGGEGQGREGGSPRAHVERVFAALPIDVPRIVTPGRPDSPGASSRVSVATAATATTARRAATEARGPIIGSRQTEEPRELDARATIMHALGQLGSARPSPSDLHEIVRKPTGRRRYVFAIDASGSQAAQQRMRLVKGAVEGLLGNSVGRADEVAIVTFRGPTAEIALPPTRDAESARQALHYLPTGGRTPLAHALDLAAGLVTDDTVFVLLTDGRANVALHSDDPWADALDAASRVACPALVIDSELGPHVVGRAREIATRMRAMYLPLGTLDGHALIDLVRPM